MNQIIKSKIKKILPSKHFLNILFSILITVALISSTYYLSQRKQTSLNLSVDKINLEKQNTNNLTPIKNEIQDADISTANLKNWENSQQTIKILSGMKAMPEATGTEPTTITGKLGRDLLTQYLNAKSTGQTLTTQEKESLAEAAISRDYSSSFDFKYNDYTKKDLTYTNAKPTAEEGQRIIDSYNAVFIKNKLKQPVDDLGIITQAFTNEDSSSLNKLDPLINMYKKISADLTKIPINEKAADMYLTIVNSLKRAGDDLNYIKTNFKDPLVAIQAMYRYQQSLESFKKSSDIAFGGTTTK
jgi:hypothetical protein